MGEHDMSWWRRLVQFLDDWWIYGGATLRVRLDKPRPYGVMNMANLQFPELGQGGLTITLKDAGGNPAPLPDKTTVTTSYSSSDPTVLTVTADPTNPFAATAKSTGKIGTGVMLSCTLSFNSGAASITGVSQPIDVPAGPPTEVDVSLGTPSAPPPAPQAKRKP
jgi:hypothetical protein